MGRTAGVRQQPTKSVKLAAAKPAATGPTRPAPLALANDETTGQAESELWEQVSPSVLLTPITLKSARNSGTVGDTFGGSRFFLQQLRHGTTSRRVSGHV